MRLENAFIAVVVVGVIFVGSANRASALSLDDNSPSNTQTNTPSNTPSTGSGSDVDELFHVMNLDKTFTPEGFKEKAQGIAQSMSLAGKVTTDQSQFIDSYITQVNFKKLKQSVADIYTRNYTHDDMKAIIAFYKSPTGSKMVSRQDEIQKETTQAIREQVINPAIEQMRSQKLMQQGQKQQSFGQ